VTEQYNHKLRYHLVKESAEESRIQKLLNKPSIKNWKHNNLSDLFLVIYIALGLDVPELNNSMCIEANEII
jgi:hypothetical protein